MKRVLWLTLLMAALCAEPARAGIFDIIWEMSGPQLFGFGAHCEFGRGERYCYYAVRAKTNDDKSVKTPKAWVIVEPSLYLATGKGKWDVGSVVMFALDPMIAVALKEDTGRHRLYTAAGASFNYFVGASVEDFGRVALKLRPLTYEYRVNGKWLDRISFSYTLRYYDGIAVTDDQFGRPLLKKGSGSEWAHGPTVVLLFK